MKFIIYFIILFYFILICDSSNDIENCKRMSFFSMITQYEDKAFSSIDEFPGKNVAFDETFLNLDQISLQGNNPNITLTMVS